MEPHANVYVRKSRNAGQINISIMIHVNASVKIHQLALIHTIMIHTHVRVFVGLMTAIQVSTLTLRAVAVSVTSI